MRSQTRSLAGEGVLTQGLRWVRDYNILAKKELHRRVWVKE